MRFATTWVALAAQAILTLWVYPSPDGGENQFEAPLYITFTGFGSRLTALWRVSAFRVCNLRWPSEGPPAPPPAGELPQHACRAC